MPAKKKRVPNPCYGAPLEKVSYDTDHFGVRLPFTPSNKQLRTYADFLAHKCVVNYHNDPPTITFDDDALKVMMKRYPKDPLYKLISDYREYEKCLGTYVGGIVPGVDGRYREAFSHNPKTLRLAMRVLQLLPRNDKKDSVYNKVRGMFVASPGKMLLARDFSGIEAVIVAYLANDPTFLRLTFLDVHGFIAAQAVGKHVDLSWGDSDLLSLFNSLKEENEEFEINGEKRPYKVIRTASKRALYLSLYGGTPKRLLEAEPEVFVDLKTAKFYQDMIFSTFPSLERWQWRTCEEADRNRYVTAPSGFRMWYPDGVFTYSYSKKKGKWERGMGEVAKECIAAKPQHMGMMFSAKAMIRLKDDPLTLEGLRLSIHDELLGEWEVDRVEEANVKLKMAMEAPMREMPLPPEWGMGDYLSVKTEGKRGMRWSEMKEF